MTVKYNKAKFSKDDIVEVYTTNDAIHIRKIGYRTPKRHTNIQNMKGGKYKTNNGAIKNQKKSHIKIDNSVSLTRSFQNLRRIIEVQLSQTKKAKILITLTYAHDCTDPKQLAHDFDVFLKRFRRYVDTHFNHAHFSYIKIFEPHEDPDANGKARWHIHFLVFGLYYIDHDVVAKLWGHSKDVDVTSLRKRDPLREALYFTGYINADETNTPKMQSKNKRLKLYPRDFAIFSTSRTIKPVKWEKMKMSEIIQAFPDAKVINSNRRVIKKDGKEVNHIDYLNLAKNDSKFVKKEYKTFNIEEFQ